MDKNFFKWNNKWSDSDPLVVYRDGIESAYISDLRGKSQENSCFIFYFVNHKNIFRRDSSADQCFDIINVGEV